MEGYNMADESEIDTGSLCIDCPLNKECGTALMLGIVLSCGKRLKATNGA